MYDYLKKNIRETLPFTESELDLLDQYFSETVLPKKTFLLEENKTCNFIAFISEGLIRHFHTKDGNEITCDISFHGAWVTEFNSFTHETASQINLQALETTKVLSISKTNLLSLYKECPKFETFGRLMAEKVAQRATDIAMSLGSEKPEERFQKLITRHPDLFLKVPQKYIANFLGISPESLSRIKRRVYQKLKS